MHSAAQRRAQALGGWHQPPCTWARTLPRASWWITACPSSDITGVTRLGGLLATAPTTIPQVHLRAHLRALLHRQQSADAAHAVSTNDRPLCVAAQLHIIDSSFTGITAFNDTTLSAAHLLVLDRRHATQQRLHGGTGLCLRLQAPQSTFTEATNLSSSSFFFMESEGTRATPVHRPCIAGLCRVLLRLQQAVSALNRGHVGCGLQSCQPPGCPYSCPGCCCSCSEHLGRRS